MNPHDLAGLYDWFGAYVQGFYSEDSATDRAIRLKEQHTLRVCGNITRVGRELGLGGADLLLAEAMALLHDVGRFRQYQKYRTFSDLASENHAALGLREMASHGVPSFGTPAEKRLLRQAIAYHNAAELPVNCSPRALLFMRLLRDADKLDIWRVLIEHFTARDRHPDSVIELGLPDTPDCSPKVLETLTKKRFVRIGDLRTLNDFKLMLISWVFDLNFKPSIRIVRRRNYLADLEATLPDSPAVRASVSHAHAHLNAVR